YAEPVSWFQNLFGTQDPIGFNATYWSSPELDKQIAEVGPLYGSDPEAANALVREMQEEVLAEVPAIPIADRLYQRAMQSIGEGFKENHLYTNAVFAYSLHQSG